MIKIDEIRENLRKRRWVNILNIFNKIEYEILIEKVFQEYFKLSRHRLKFYENKKYSRLHFCYITLEVSNVTISISQQSKKAF